MSEELFKHSMNDICKTVPTKWVHDLGLGLGPIPIREVSREELEKMYPAVDWCEPCNAWHEAEKHLDPSEIERDPLYVQWIGHVAWARRITQAVVFLKRFFHQLWAAGVGNLPKNTL